MICLRRNPEPDVETQQPGSHLGPVSVLFCMFLTVARERPGRSECAPALNNTGTHIEAAHSKTVFLP